MKKECAYCGEVGYGIDVEDGGNTKWMCFECAEKARGAEGYVVT